MLQALDVRDTVDGGHVGNERRRRADVGGWWQRDRDVCAVGEDGVDFGLLPVRAVEHRRRDGEGDGERDECAAASEQSALTAQARGDGVTDLTDRRANR